MFDSVLLLLVLLFTKHFVLDFILQTPYQFLNKGKYGHPGGILHSGLQGIGTTLCFFIVDADGMPVYLVFGLIDFLVHYHVDWLKVQLNTIYKLTQENPYYWWLLGADQYLHALTYIFLLSLVVP